MIEKEVQELLSFIDGNPTAYHTTASVRNILLKEGFSELLESRRWQLEPGGSYFVCRNGSSILAVRMGEQLENYSFNVAAAHTDSPCFRIKENAEIHMGRKYTKLNTEGYGGMICSTWMDRPLSVAGRVLIKENNAITSRLLTLDRDLLMIPSVAIHMNREVNDKAGRCRRGRRAEKADRRRAAGCRRADPWQRPVPLHPRKGRRLGLQ